ncbi:MAG: MarR family transcriptional regulator [Bacteroidales bacterium]|nr:MarR family transcriptional regulator [Bacteroidales bacterium]
MDNDQINRIEEMLMLIPTKMCRNMNQRFVNFILKDLSKELAKHHFMILKMLQEKEKFYVTEIVQMLGITKSQMTTSVDKLLKLGYVERWSDTQDRRKIYVSITKDGEKITEKINTRIKERFYEDIKVLSQNDLNELEKGLKVLNKLCSISEQ